MQSRMIKVIVPNALLMAVCRHNPQKQVLAWMASFGTVERIGVE